jgi:hypothetical protein
MHAVVPLPLSSAAFHPTPLRWIGGGIPPEQADMLDVEATVHRHNKARTVTRSGCRTRGGGRALNNNQPIVLAALLLIAEWGEDWVDMRVAS